MRRCLLTALQAAVLAAGINTPDHAAIFAGLVEHLKAEVVPHVIHLRAREHKTLRALVSAVVGGVISASEEEEGTVKAAADFRALEAWCAAQPPRPPGAPAAIAVVEDFEAFDPDVLSDFVVLCSQHRAAVPLSLVLGVVRIHACVGRPGSAANSQRVQASTAAVVGQQLSRRAITRLDTARFRLPHTSTVLDALVEELLSVHTAAPESQRPAPLLCLPGVRLSGWG